MSYIFIDTTSGVHLGLWSKEKSWISFNSYETARGSTILHSKIFEILEKNNVLIKNLHGVIQISGPGSYTGMRLSAGLTDILNWQGMTTLGIYHYEIPSLVGIAEGNWVCKAFKNEYLCYTWNKNGNSKELLTKEQMINKINSETYTHHQSEWSFDLKVKSSLELLKDKADDLFAIVIKQKLNRELYYFREIAQEFSKPKI